MPFSIVNTVVPNTAWKPKLGKKKAINLYATRNNISLVHWKKKHNLREASSQEICKKKKYLNVNLYGCGENMLCRKSSQGVYML